MANTPLREENFLYNRKKTPLTRLNYKEVPIEDAIMDSAPTLYAHDAYIYKIEWRKKKIDKINIARHEFLALYISEKKNGTQYQRHSVAILERLSNPKVIADNPDQNSETSASSSSSHIQRPTLSSSSSNVLSSRSTVAIDKFIFTIDSTDCFINEYEGKADILKTLYPGENITLRQVLAAASAVSQAYPTYQLINSNCYYFASQSYYVLYGLAGDKKDEVDGPNETFRGKNIIKVYGSTFELHRQNVKDLYDTELIKIGEAIAQVPVGRQEHDREVKRLTEDAKSKGALLEEAKKKEQEAKKREDMLREETKKKEQEANKREDMLREEAKKKEEEIRRLRQLLREGSTTLS